MDNSMEQELFDKLHKALADAEYAATMLSEESPNYNRAQLEEIRAGIYELVCQAGNVEPA